MRGEGLRKKRCTLTRYISISWSIGLNMNSWQKQPSMFLSGQVQGVQFKSEPRCMAGLTAFYFLM
jgi:hypothetical protein